MGTVATRLGKFSVEMLLIIIVPNIVVVPNIVQRISKVIREAQELEQMGKKTRTEMFVFLFVCVCLAFIFVIELLPAKFFCRVYNNNSSQVNF